VNPSATMEILKGIENYCVKNKIESINQLRGTFQAARAAGGH
jgi:hypothetical protein